MVQGGPGCKFVRREAAKARVGSLLVIVGLPLGNQPTRLPE